MIDESTVKSAVIDPSGTYRYSLTRSWHSGRPRVCWVMLNPSTADAEVDDPTIRKCIGFSRLWGFGALEVVNLFAYRATSPKALPLAKDPVGPDNAAFIRDAIDNADKVVAAWGADVMAREGSAPFACIVWARSTPVYHLGLTKAGAPRHPLYLPYSTPLEFWSDATEAPE
jgi:hypothetical protein